MNDSPTPSTPGQPPAPETDSAAPSTAGPAKPGSRRALLIGLLALVVAMLITIAVLITALVVGGAAAPEPEPEPEETVEPVPAEIASFSADSLLAQCANDSAGTTAPVLLSWSVTNAVEIAIAVSGDEIDAIDESGVAILDADVTGYGDLPYPCDEQNRVYSLTAAGDDGEHVTTSILIERELPAPPPLPSFTNARWSDGLDYASCPSFDNGSTVKKQVQWSANGPGTVSLFYAKADDYYPGASANYTRFASGLPLSGSYDVTIDCGTSGYSSFFTVRVVVSNETGADVELVSGNTAS